MAQEAESLNTNLQLNGTPVLVQNTLGIFYGILEKSDTRNGTALLRDSFMLSPERHITFSQYVDFLYGTIEMAYLDSIGKIEEADGEEYFEPEPVNEIVVDHETFSEHTRNLSISDYASEGIALVQYRTSTYWNAHQLQRVTPLISLTNVLAITSISHRAAAIHHKLRELFDDVEEQTGEPGFLQQLLPANGAILDPFKYTILSTFENLAANPELTPRLVVNTPQREELFNKTGL